MAKVDHRSKKKLERVFFIRRAVFLTCVVFVIAGGILLGSALARRGAVTDSRNMATLAPSGTPRTTAAATATPSPTATPAPKFSKGLQESQTVSPSSAPDHAYYNFRTRLLAADGSPTYARANAIHMEREDSYAQVDGVTTFRGNHYRDNSAFGVIPGNPTKLTVEWTVPVGRIGEWSGVGWTGQPALVRWPDALREKMNMTPDKRTKSGLVEVVIAALDGKIRFLDLDDGKETRRVIDIKAPIKGSVTVDPRGYPLLYCGQGIDIIDEREVKTGTRIFSLIDQNLLFFLDGRDAFRTRNWYASDPAPLIDGKTDTMFQPMENALFYIVDLNTRFDAESGAISVAPSVNRFAYKSKISTRPGMENSVAVYNRYGYFVDNSGLLMCLDLNTLTAVWLYDVGDDTDATCAIEEADDGSVTLYTACEVDLRPSGSPVYMRAFDALSGEMKWSFSVNAQATESANGGAYASPAIGKNALSELVFFNIARTKEKGTLFALSKKTGEIVWSTGLGSYSWSTPALVYDAEGNGYIVIGNSGGTLALLDGLSGEILAKVSLKSNIEGSPAVFDDMIVVGTRGGRVHGVRIQ